MNAFKCVCGLSIRNIKYSWYALNLEGTSTSGKFIDFGLLGIRNQCVALRVSQRNLTNATRNELLVQKEEFRPRSNVQSSEEAVESIRLQKIKKMLIRQFEAADLQDKSMKEMEDDFQIGKRHLANMMGMDPENFSQTDIDLAIEYLMPSGLFEKRARPVMKPPKELMAKDKDLEVDSLGRPYNTFFFTGRGRFYEIFHNISAKLEEIHKFEDQRIAQGHATPPPDTKLNLEESTWISFKLFKEQLLDEKLPETEFDYLLESLERLLKHPYSYIVKDFILQYRKPKLVVQMEAAFPPLTVDEDGVPYSTATGARKHTRAEVTVRFNGTGKVEIFDEDIGYFRRRQDREQIMFPMKMSGLLNQVDIKVKLTGVGGSSSESGAIRHGVALALCSFVPTDTIQKLRIAGLLEMDKRFRERKKYGRKGARAKYTWNKR